MKFFDRLKFLFSNNREEVLKKWTSGLDFTGGTPYGFSVSGDNALKYNAFWACCRVLGETFATVPVFEYRTLENGDREKTNDTGLYDVLHYQYNDEMSAFSAKEMSMYQLNLGGNAVFTRETNRLKQVLGLVPHQWQNVEIDRDNTTSKLQYKIKLANNTTKTYTRSEVFHVAGPSLDGIIGMSPIEYAVNSIRLGTQYDRFSTEFYKNGVMSSGVLEYPSELTDEAYHRLRDGFSNSYAGLLNSGKPIILEDGAKYNPLAIKLSDAELLSSKKFQVEDIARIFRMPLHMVQSMEHATNNNIEMQSLEFVMYTMLPHFKRQEDAINTQLLSRKDRDSGYYFEYNMNALLRGDTKSMYEAFAQGRQWGFLSVNDIRRLLNMNSIGPEGDIYLQPVNMVDVSKPQQQPSEQVLNQVYDLLEESKYGKGKK